MDPARLGIEATGSMQWFLELMEKLGLRFEDCTGGSFVKMCSHPR
jgi:hypothetical protein